jgi:hypothetical protein
MVLFAAMPTGAAMTIFLVFSIEGLAAQDYDLFCLVLVCLTLFEASPS